MSEQMSVVGEVITKSPERVFLHDLSNQLLIAQGMGSYCLQLMEKGTPIQPKDIERMRKVISSVDNMINLVKQRRVYVKAQEEALKENQSTATST